MEEVIKILKQIQDTSSKIEKETIIRNNKDNELFKKCLVFLLDNNITTGISKAKINKVIKTINFTCFNEHSFEECMNYIIKNNTGTDADIAIVQRFIRLQPEEYQEFYKQMITKSLKLGCDSKTVNKSIPNLITTFDVMLGTSIENCKIPKNTYFSISQKLNGSRCVYLGGEFWTRQGKKYCGLNHIKTDIEYLFGKQNNIVLDGELIYKNPEGLSDSEAFQKGVGIANSKEENKPELKLVIFDILDKEEFLNGKSILTYKDRKKDLQSLNKTIIDLGLENVHTVSIFYEGTDQSEINRWLDYAENKGYEGIMLNLDAPYECKRTKNLIKVKKFFTMDLEIIGVIEGEGRLKDTLGALIVKYKNNTVNVGSGFDDKTRLEIWKNKDGYIGRIAEVKYKEITKDKNTGLESLQFPIFVQIREKGKIVSYD